MLVSIVEYVGLAIADVSVIWCLVALAWVLVEMFKDKGGPGIWIPSIPCCIFAVTGAFILFVVIFFV